MKPMTKKKKYNLIACIILIILAVIFYLILHTFYNMAISAKSSKDKVFTSSHNIPTKSYDLTDITAGNNQFKKQAHIVQTKSFDNLNLSSYILTHEEYSDKWVIINHGYMQQPYQMGHTGIRFFADGYNVLLPHMRGHGESDGEYIGMGYHDRLDIIKWINYILSVDNSAKIVIYGVSMGGAAAMMVSGEKLPENVKCFIEDCGYTSAWDEFAYQLKAMYNLPTFPIMDGVNILVKIRAGYDLKDASALNQVAKCSKPMLFIHGDKDTFVPYDMLQKLYIKASCPEKELFTAHNAGHAESFKLYTNIYWQKVLGFAGKYTK